MNQHPANLKKINNVDELRRESDAVVVTAQGRSLWYRGKVGDELKFTQPVEGSVTNGRSITDFYYSPSQVTLSSPNCVVLEGLARKDTYTGAVVNNSRFRQYMNTERALKARGL